MEEHIKHTRLPFSCGAGEALVNIRTGRMTFIHPDLEAGDGDYCISIGHVYNPEIPFADLSPCMGNGWKLNVQQYIIPDQGNDGSDADAFTYVDAKGHSHRFDQSHGATRYYYAEGANLTLQVLDRQCRDGEDARYVIIDRAENQKYFDASGRLISIVSAADPYADKVFEYEEDRLSVIYDVRSPSDKITLEYEGKRLSKITYEEAGDKPARLVRTLCYGYDTKGNLSGIIRRTLNPDDKTETVESVTCFEYDLEKDIGTPDPLYRLTKAVDGKDNSALQIDYSDETSEGVYRVQKVASGYCVVMTESDSSDPYGYGYGDNFEATFEGGCGLAFSISPMSGSGVKAWTEFTPGDYSEGEPESEDYVVVTEDNEGIIFGHYFDRDGFATNVLTREPEPEVLKIKISHAKGQEQQGRSQKAEQQDKSQRTRAARQESKDKNHKNSKTIKTKNRCSSTRRKTNGVRAPKDKTTKTTRTTKRQNKTTNGVKAPTGEN